MDEEEPSIDDQPMPAPWYIAGHTRQSTCYGKNDHKDECAHPFRYGKVIGAHNGVIDAPFKYDVDSQYLFDRLNECKGDYQKAWRKISGYWAVQWSTSRNFLRFQAVNNSVAFAYDQESGDFYWSSATNHLQSAIGIAQWYRLEDDSTIQFQLGKGDVKTLPPMQRTKAAINPPKQKYTYATTYADGWSKDSKGVWRKHYGNDYGSGKSYKYWQQSLPDRASEVEVSPAMAAEEAAKAESEDRDGNPYNDSLIAYGNAFALHVGYSSLEHFMDDMTFTDIEAAIDELEAWTNQADRQAIYAQLGRGRYTS